MAGNYRRLMLLSLMAGCLALFALPCMAQQQASLGPIGNTTVTLYYYDDATGTRGDIVPMPDNPQTVNVDPAVAAPGMYTFSHVPAGRWYYLEANHSGSKWYAIFYMEEGVGTKTQNVHIPPMQPVGPEIAPSPSASPSASPAPTATPQATAPPQATATARPSPGMPAASAALAILLTAGLAMFFTHRR